MPGRVPIVNYLVLDDGPPHLMATVCVDCGARFLAERIACARCGKRRFDRRALPTTGTVGSFTIVYRAAPGVAVPYVSALVDLADGTTVKANVVGCLPDPALVTLHMPVRLCTFEAGTDDDGVVAVAFGFEPSPAAGAADGPEWQPAAPGAGTAA